MRTVRRLATGHDFAISELRIVRDTPAWTAPEPVPDQRLVFVRRGVFRLRVDGWRGVADPLLAYVGQPGAEQSIAHRPGAEDVCTVITLPADGSLDRGFRAVHTTGKSWLAHRVLVARARAGAEEFELSERISALAGDLLQPSGGGAPVDCRLSIVCSRQSTIDRAQRRLAEAAREALSADPVGLRLDVLAREVGASRSHLSRVFRRVTGETLTRFRIGLRVRAALDRIEGGETDLARLAAELGFSDHAHLTRTLRAETGATPSRVRAMLSTNLQAGKAGVGRD